MLLVQVSPAAGLAAAAISALAWLLSSPVAVGTSSSGLRVAQVPLISKTHHVGDDTGGSPFTVNFEKVVLETLEAWHVPGLSMAVVDGDNIYTQGFGFATLPSTPVTSSTLFMAGSTTKAFTDAALALLIDSGNYSTPPRPGGGGNPEPLSWRTPITAVLPEDFVVADAWATAHLTLEDAATHRTGLSRHDAVIPRFVEHEQDGSGPRRNATVRDVVRLMRYLPMAAEPRTTWMYCNLMYMVLAHCVETLAGRWLGDVLRERIWAPLGMRGTYFSLEDAIAAPEDLAMGYYWDAQTSQLREVQPMSLGEVSGAGAVLTSAHDYGLWVKSLLDEAGPLPARAHATLREPKMVMSAERGPFDTPQVYAVGAWMATSYRGHRLFTHSGVMEAYGAEIYFFPDDGYGVVTLANTATSSNAVGEILLWRLVDERFGVPEAERYAWDRKWEKIFEEIEHKIDTAVDRLYPNRPKSPIPPALPLKAYAGTYYNPAYKNLTLMLPESDSKTRTDKALLADRTHSTWQSKLEFDHVSGEHWVMYSEMAKEPGLVLMSGYGAARFEIGVDGRVTKFGIEERDTSSEVVDGWVWYDRVA